MKARLGSLSCLLLLALNGCASEDSPRGLEGSSLEAFAREEGPRRADRLQMRKDLVMAGFTGFPDDGTLLHDNVFSFPDGRIVAVQIKSLPREDNTYGDEVIWVGDITTLQYVESRELPWNLESERFQLRTASGDRCDYEVRRTTNALGDVALRVESKGVYFEVSLRGLRTSRGKRAREGEVCAMSGYRKLFTPWGADYFAPDALDKGNDPWAVRPVYVTHLYDTSGARKPGRAPLGSSGYVVYWDPSPMGGFGPTWREEKVAEAGAAGELNAEQLFRRCGPSFVTVRDRDGIGSGSYVRQGLVLTNAHVATSPIGASVQVAELGKPPRPGKILAKDATRDLALIEVPGASARPLVLHAQLPPVGGPIAYIGTPARGAEGTLGQGHVSGYQQLAELGGQVIQVQAPVNPGNSGGPLLDLRGRQVGVIVARGKDLPDGKKILGIGFAIPAADAIRLLQRAGR